MMSCRVGFSSNLYEALEAALGTKLVKTSYVLRTQVRLNTIAITLKVLLQACLIQNN